MFFSEHSVYDAERELLAIAKFLVHDLSAFVSDVVQFRCTIWYFIEPCDHLQSRERETLLLKLVQSVLGG